MKRLIMVNGTMGAGKTTTCKELMKLLDRSVFLDGDWCWTMNPFVVTEETKRMVQDNICYMLKNFLTCSEFENIIFCWVMQYESIINDIVQQLAGIDFELYKFTLMVSEAALTQRIMQDVNNRIRTPDVLERSLARLPLYDKMDTIKVDVSHIKPQQVADYIRKALQEG